MLALHDSLGLAADPLSAVATVAVLVVLLVALVVVVALAASVVSVAVLLLERLQLAHSRVRIALLSRSLAALTLTGLGNGAAERFLEDLGTLCVDGCGELNLELDYQVAVLVDALVERHAEVLAGEHRVGLDHLARLVLDAHLPSVKVGQHEVETSQSFEQGDLLVHKEVSALTLEELVLLLLDDDDDIAGLCVGHLVALAVLDVLLTVGRALVDLDRQRCALLLKFLAVAGLAHLRRVDALALPAALVARTCALRVHAGAELHHDGAHALALAALAGLDGLLVGAADTVALGADAMSVELDLRLLAVVQIFQGHVQLHSCRLHLLRAARLLLSATSHSEEVEDVVEALGLGSVAEALLAVLVVGLALLGIAQYLIGHRNLLEL